MAESPFSDDLDLDFLNWASGLSGAESADTLGELENLFADPGESVDPSAHSDADITGESELPPSNVALFFGEPEIALPEKQEFVDGWGELERSLSDPTPQESVDLSAHSDSDTDVPGESELPPSNVAFLFGEPEVTPPEEQASPAQELTLPPPLWAEIGHLFQTPAFSEATPNQPANPTIASEIDTLSQAMLANDGETIQALVQQIQETYDELKSIEIFLAATRNLCY